MIGRLCADVGSVKMPKSMPIAIPIAIAIPIPIVQGIRPPCAACKGHAFQEWPHA
ncbi:MAG: hypothetical protein H6Q05_552 [Acidobacteria bacterium]|nr:hypothetical protein [Acidobacteriota bacterium]